jgi:23S rRNA (cytosine1962-C5)-methyltransferase
VSVRVYLRRDARKVARERRRWIRVAQIQRIQGPADPAELAQIHDSKQNPVGWGLYSPDSDLRVRVLTWDPKPLATDWLEQRIARALARRAEIGLDAGAEDAETTGYREINSEGDELPGLVVDRYGEHRVIQITTAPMAARQAAILAALEAQSPGVTPLVLRPERAAARDGFAPGFEGPQLEAMHYREHGVDFAVPGPPTQKTGGYHDQRDNRHRVAELAAADGRPLLDLGSHVGGFSVHAASRGVSALAVDSSAHMLSFVERNAQGLPGEVEVLQADMFAPLKDPALQGPFGTIVFDPPKIASKPSDKGRAISATTRVLEQLFDRLAPGGHLVICSCSHHFTREDMNACVRRVAEARERPSELIESRGPGLDHPVHEGHAQGEYLRVNIYRCD